MEIFIWSIVTLIIVVAAIAVTRQTRRTAVLTEQLLILALLESDKISADDVSNLVGSKVIDEAQGNFIINRIG